MEIDLHGIRHQDVPRAVDNGIWECMQSKAYTLTIITGMSDDMKRIVMEVAQEYGLTVHENYYNPGALTIDMF